MIPLSEERSLSAALERFADALGTDAVLTAPEDVREFGDPYAPVTWPEQAPPAVLQPATVAEVQAVVRIAAEHRVAVWPTSQGRNNGYGGSAPRHPGTVVVNLRRMNRVLEVDDDLAYAVVEPGVSYIELDEHLQAAGHRLWVDCPDLGWGSVVGNALDHGFGYGRYGEHAASQCGMEVVLASGDVLRTGYGALPGGKSWSVVRRGFGPAADALFMQSNFGIVTKMGIWLMPEPECYVSGRLLVAEDSGLEPMIEAVRPLMIEGTISGLPNVFFGNGDFGDPAAEDAAWQMRFALYGREALVDRQLEIAQDAFAAIPGARVLVEKHRENSHRGSEDVDTLVQGGVPNLRMLEWLQMPDGRPLGHVCFSAVIPSRGADARAINSLVRESLREAGFPEAGGMIVNTRCLIHICAIPYALGDEAAAQRAHDLCAELVVKAAELGYGEYRAHLNEMDIVAAQFDWEGGALMRFNETLKDALDPHGILAPGKSGIWPSRMRQAGSTS